MKLTQPLTKLRGFALPPAGNKGFLHAASCMSWGCIRAGARMGMTWHSRPPSRCTFWSYSCSIQDVPLPSLESLLSPSIRQSNSVACVSPRVGHCTFYASRIHLSSEFTPFPAVCASMLYPASLESTPKSSINSPFFNFMFLPPWSGTLSPTCISPSCWHYILGRSRSSIRVSSFSSHIKPSMSPHRLYHDLGFAFGLVVRKRDGSVSSEVTCSCGERFLHPL